LKHPKLFQSNQRRRYFVQNLFARQNAIFETTLHALVRNKVTNFKFPLSRTGLPDGLFSYQKVHFGTFWKSLEWEILVNSIAIWYFNCHFGIFYGHLVFLYHFGVYLILVWFAQKDLATLVLERTRLHIQKFWARIFKSMTKHFFY
jgi:hypothetical protein